MQLASPPPEVLPLLVRTDAASPVQPVTVGVALAKGWCPDGVHLSLWGPAGGAVPVQCVTTDRWSDGSTRWLLLDFQAPAQPGAALYQLRRGGPIVAGPAVTVAADGSTARIETGGAAFTIVRDSLTVSAEMAGSAALRGTMTLDVPSGRAAWRGAQIEVETAGPLRVTVLVRGSFHAADASLDAVARFTFYAGLALVRADFTLVNPRPAHHAGGIWELGDPGSLFIRDAAFSFAPSSTSASSVLFREQPDAAPVACALPFELYQGSSGGANWRSPTHVDRTGEIPLTIEGFRRRCGGAEACGRRSTPAVVLRDADGAGIAGVAVPRFWQNFPQAIEADAGAISVRMFPHQAQRPFELQGGEQKTHTFYAVIGREGCDHALDWSLRQPVACLTPEAWCAAGAALLPVGPPMLLDAAQQRLIDGALDAEHGFAAKREAADEYGWRNFGDMPADHEGVRARGGATFVSHYNNQYDGVWGCWLQFMRTADPRWRDLAGELAAHVVDIDIYHTSGDKSAYNHGLFWHTFHYVDAGRSTHRGYPKAPGVWGGGPSSEHNYTSGLLFQYYATGDVRYRDAVLEMASWVLAMDDGAATPLKWISRGPTGLASATASADYHGPGRGGAYSVNTLLNAFQLTRSGRYLAAAEALLRRCIHPRDDIGARNLLDAERRWSYTVFLQVLGRYLDVKQELGELDGMYAYGRESLLAYAGWMAEHERPYLDRAESLEFATETWVAQDLRKSDVFVLAACHAAGAARERFLERARFFRDYAVRTLGAMPTRTLTRPLVLVLSNGLLLAAAESAGVSHAPPPVVDASYGAGPACFRPQKAVALRRLRWAAGAGAAAAAAGLVAIWLLWR